jgi:1,2-diacylglycerol 3-alpha-glucosyltransferase
MHVLVITPIPTPYRDPFWDCVAALDDVRLTVVYCSRGRSDRPWQADPAETECQRLFPPTRNLLSMGGWGASCYWTPQIRKLLSELHPDVVLLGGYNHLTMLNAASWCRKHDVPFLLMCETWRQRSGMKAQLKQAWLRRWLARAAGALPTGTLAEDHLVSLGVSRDRLCRVPNVPDIDSLQAMKRRCDGDRPGRRSRLGIDPNAKLVLFAARMVPKKRPAIVLDAFSQLDSSLSAELVMLGDGPELASVKQLAQESMAAGRVHFKGFVTPAEVHEWMCLADVFVQPSSETWGVAPIEALACGCPVILSREIGCHADVLSNPADGVCLEVVETSHLAEAMTTLLNVERQAIGRSASNHRGLSKIATQDLPHSCTAFC